MYKYVQLLDNGHGQQVVICAEQLFIMNDYDPVTVSTCYLTELVDVDIQSQVIINDCT